MENTKLLSDMGVCDGSTVYQVLKLRGGGEAKESNGYQMSLSKLPGETIHGAVAFRVQPSNSL